MLSRYENSHDPFSGSEHYSLFGLAIICGVLGVVANVAAVSANGSEPGMNDASVSHTNFGMGLKTAGM